MQVRLSVGVWLADASGCGAERRGCRATSIDRRGQLGLRSASRGVCVAGAERRWTFDSEGVGQERSLAAPRRVVQVLHRRVDVRVAHPLLDLQDRRLRDRPRAEGVAQVVEAEVRRPARSQRELVAPVQRRGVEVLAGDARRRRGRRRRSSARVPRAARAPAATSGAIGTERTLPDFGVVSDAARCSSRRRGSRWPAKSTSRQRSATSSPRRRPVNAAVRKIAASCSDVGGAHERHDLLGREDVDRRRSPLASASRRRAPGCAAARGRSARALDDPVEHREDLDLRPVRERRSSSSRQRSTRSAVRSSSSTVAERGQEMGARRSSGSRAASTACARGRPRATPGTPRRPRRRSRRCGRGPGSVPRARLVEHVAQPVLGGALREVARPPAARAPSTPARSVFWTWRPSGSRYFAYQTGPRLRSTRKTWPEIGRGQRHRARSCPFSGHIGDTLDYRRSARNAETAPQRGFRDAGGGTRTPDTRIMIPA